MTLGKFNRMRLPMNKFEIAPEKPWLAPLAGYSDLSFRLLCKEYDCAVGCSEMVSVKGLHYKNGGTARLLRTCKEDNPMVLQLFGADPELFGPVMDKLIAQGYRYFDLNSGCPVRKVLKSGSGVALMTDIDKLVKIASIMVEKVSQIPDGGMIGVKFRLGFMQGEDIYIEVGQRLEQAGVDWITLHPRYGKQMFMGAADWSKLALLKQAVSIPVVGSGDLFTAHDGVRCIKETGIDAVMYARGAMHNPSIFRQHIALLNGDTPLTLDGPALSEIIQNHIRITRTHEDDKKSFRKLRSLIPRYAKGLEGIRSFRANLVECKNWDELVEAAKEIEQMQSAER